MGEARHLAVASPGVDRAGCRIVGADERHAFSTRQVPALGVHEEQHEPATALAGRDAEWPRVVGILGTRVPASLANVLTSQFQLSEPIL